MPTIRIEEDVFKALQSLAQPFTDTPNSVIRRMLVERDTLQKLEPAKSDKSQKDAPSPVRRGSRTNQSVYENHLLFVLGTKFNGRATKSDATAETLALMESKGLLPPDGHEILESTGESKAGNTVAWGRNALKDAGMISSHSQRGIWELTASGLDKSKSDKLKAELEM